MNKFAGRLLLLSTLISTSSFALDCSLSPKKRGMACKGTKRVKTQLELENYLSDYAINLKGEAKHLLVDFDMNLGSSDLEIASPCRVRIKKKRKIETTGSICLNGLDGVRVHPESYIRAKDIKLYSDKKIAILHHADIKGDNILLESTGSSLESRVHIRHHSNIEANTLTLSAHARATLGHTSLYNVLDSISLSSHEVFSAIWRDTKINSKFIEINSGNKTKISKNVEISAETVDISGPECVAKKAIINTAKQIGNCFDTGRPRAVLKLSSKTASTGDEITFNASKSSDDKGIVKYL